MVTWKVEAQDGYYLLMPHGPFWGFSHGGLFLVTLAIEFVQSVPHTKKTLVP